MADRRRDTALAGNILRVVIYIDLQAGIVAEFTYYGGHEQFVPLPITKAGILVGFLVE